MFSKHYLFQLLILSSHTFSPWDGVWLSYPILSYPEATDMQKLSQEEDGETREGVVRGVRSI